MKVFAKKVVKINSQPGDAHTDGTKGYLIAELGPVGNLSMGFILFPTFSLPIGVASTKYIITDVEEEVIELREDTALYLEELKQALPSKLSNLINIKCYEKG